jgi:hypothetical protein
VAHACKPSYSGGRDQEDGSLKQPGQIVHETLFQKTLYKNRAGGMAQDEGPEFKPQYCKYIYIYKYVVYYIYCIYNIYCIYIYIYTSYKTFSEILIKTARLCFTWEKMCFCNNIYSFVILY